MTTIGQQEHLVTVQHVATAADSDGSYTETWTDGVPSTWYASIQPATAVDLERVTFGTVISQASHVVRGHYRPDFTTKSRLLYDSRVLHIVSVATVDERNWQTVLVCSEVIQ